MNREKVAGVPLDTLLRLRYKSDSVVRSGGHSLAVHCKKSKYDVYIARPSKWGNPYTIGRDGTRREVIAKYETWIRSNPKLMADLHELKGRVLGCWCAPLPCHGDVLERLANELGGDTK